MQRYEIPMWGATLQQDAAPGNPRQRENSSALKPNDI